MPIRHKQAPPEEQLYAPVEWRSAGEFEDILYEKADGIAKIRQLMAELRGKAFASGSHRLGSALLMQRWWLRARQSSDPIAQNATS